MRYNFYDPQASQTIEQLSIFYYIPFCHYNAFSLKTILNNKISIEYNAISSHNDLIWVIWEIQAQPTRYLIGLLHIPWLMEPIWMKKTREPHLDAFVDLCKITVDSNKFSDIPRERYRGIILHRSSDSCDISLILFSSWRKPQPRYSSVLGEKLVYLTIVGFVRKQLSH